MHSLEQLREMNEKLTHMERCRAAIYYITQERLKLETIGDEPWSHFDGVLRDVEAFVNEGAELSEDLHRRAEEVFVLGAQISHEYKRLGEALFLVAHLVFFREATTSSQVFFEAVIAAFEKPEFECTILGPVPELGPDSRMISEM